MSRLLQTLIFIAVGTVVVGSVTLEDLVEGSQHLETLRQAVFEVPDSDIMDYNWQDDDYCLALVKLAVHRLRMLDKTVYKESLAQRAYDHLLLDVMGEAIEDVGSPGKQMLCQKVSELIARARV